MYQKINLAAIQSTKG